MNQQELEQAEAALRDKAKYLFAHFTHLTKQGFTRTEALQLTIAMQQSLLTQPGGNK